MQEYTALLTVPESALLHELIGEHRGKSAILEATEHHGWVHVTVAIDDVPTLAYISAMIMRLRARRVRLERSLAMAAEQEAGEMPPP